MIAQLPGLLPEVRRFTFALYSPRPGVVERVRDDMRIAGTELQESTARLQKGLPPLFEHLADLSALIEAALNAPEAVLMQMLHHDDTDRGTARKAALELTQTRFRRRGRKPSCRNEQRNSKGSPCRPSA